MNKMKHAIEAVNERAEMAVGVANSNTTRSPMRDMAQSFTSRETKAAQDTALASSLQIKGSANFNINQQPHGWQSVTQPAPNCASATSPC